MEIITGEDLSQVERQGIEWLAARRQWKAVTVQRRPSGKPFDLLLGTHVFMEECLFEFWRMGIFGIGRDSGAFIYLLPPATLRNEFNRVLKLAASKPLFSRELVSAVWSVWGDVNPDMGRCSNAEAIETVLDADRLTTFGHKQADDEVSWLIDRFGYERVAAALAREIRLV